MRLRDFFIPFCFCHEAQDAMRSVKWVFGLPVNCVTSGVLAQFGNSTTPTVEHALISTERVRASRTRKVQFSTERTDKDLTRKNKVRRHEFPHTAVHDFFMKAVAKNKHFAANLTLLSEIIIIAYTV